MILMYFYFSRIILINKESECFYFGDDDVYVDVRRASDVITYALSAERQH